MKDNGKLSQEEIDALLDETVNLDENENNEEVYFTDLEKDTLGEIGNISIGNSATALSQLLNQKVKITTPNVKVLPRNKLEDEFPKPYVAVVVDYTKGFSGSNLLIINEYDALVIADLMMGGDGKPEQVELTELHLSALQEAMNQMMGSAATSMSTIFDKRVEISPPLVDMLNIPEGVGIENIPGEDLVVKVSFELIVGDLIDSQIMQILPISFAKSLLSELNRGTAGRTAEQIDEAEVAVDTETTTTTTRVESAPRTETARDYEQHEPKQQEEKVRPAVFSHFDTETRDVAKKPLNLEMLYDIPLQVTVELGRTTKFVREILELAPGSIIELDKLAGEPVDIYVNRRRIARGEVVVIDENFGVRITEIGSQEERLNNMKE